MTYYAFIQDNKINGVGQCPCLNEEIQNIEITEEVFNAIVEDKDTYIWDGTDVVVNPDYEEIKRQQKRKELDKLTLTPSDVERALYYSELKMDFEDLKTFIHEKLPNLDIKGLGIEFRARDFYRGAIDKNSGMRLFDVVGQLLGYTSEDMDYLFINKELPIKNNENTIEE